MRVNIKKGDIIIIIVCLILISSFYFFYINNSPGNYVIIKVNNQEKEYSLNKNQTIFLEIDSLEYNIVEINNGKVYMKESTCLNQNCVNHKPIYKNRESIVCLPHNVFIEVISNNFKEVDN